MTLVEQSVAAAPRAEAGLVPLGSWLHGEDSKESTRVSIFVDSGQRCIATALVTPAEESSAFGRFKLPRAALGRCIVVSDVMLDPAADSALSTLMYACLRRGRIWDRATIVTAVSGEAGGDRRSAESPDRFDLTPLYKLQPTEHGGTTWTPVAQRIDLSIHRAWTQTSTAMQGFLQEQFSAEAVETLNRWIERFFKTPWFQSIYDGTLTREQYGYCLANQHQFVRYTTRLIGRAVSHSDDRAMRNKWLEHLQGEINHELIIEKDLQALQADVDYVVHWMVPNVANQQFMVAQESAIAFHMDPVLFMAAPFVAEGFTARLDHGLIDALRRTAKSWGVDNPKQVTAFWSSHVEYDGGDDGHWEHSRRMLDDYLRTDRDLQRFLNVVRLACNAFERSYTSYVEDLAIFGATPATPS